MRVGIIGAGGIAHKMAQTLSRMTEAEAYAIASRTAGKSEAFARQYGMSRAYGSYEALLEDDAIDLVYIALPHSHHCEWTLAALDAGKHVLCEKAFAANAAQADPDAFNEAVVQAFESEDRLVLSGERTYYFDESGSDATLQFNLGDFCTSKFYVLTASRHQELSWGSESRRCNVFTEALAEGVMNTMPADTETGNGDSVVNLHELFLYIKTNATGPYVVSGVTYYQHVQEYPKNSTYTLFKKLA